MNNLSILSLQDFYAKKAEYPLLEEIALYRCWLYSLLTYDTATAKALPMDSDGLLKKISTLEEIDPDKDYLYPIIFRTEKMFRSLTSELRDKILREHNIISIHQVRQVDSKSIQWISKKPGRTIREKIAKDGKILAPQRRLSLDTLENRLLKDFSKRLKGALLARNEHCMYAATINAWLHSESCNEIGVWQSSPPNNILLHDNKYRKIWESYLKLQKLPQIIESDIKRQGEITLTYIYWNLIEMIKQYVAIMQCPVIVNEEQFDVSPLVGVEFLLEEARYRLNRRSHTVVIEKNKQNIIEIQWDDQEKSVSVNYLGNPTNGIDDVIEFVENTLFKNEKPLRVKPQLTYSKEKIYLNLNGLKPMFWSDQQFHILPIRLWRQTWERDGVEFYANCGSSEAIALNHRLLKSNDTLYSLLFGKNENVSKSEQAQFFGQQLATIFQPKKLYYLLPEHLTEFSLKEIKGALRSSFMSSIPMPRSISAVYAYLSSNQKTAKAGDCYYIVDAPGKGISLTRIEAKEDPELKKVFPESKGIVWVRYPTIWVDIPDIVKPFHNHLSKTISNNTIETILDLMGGHCLRAEQDNLYFIDDNKWNKLPKDLVTAQHNQPEILAQKMLKEVDNKLKKGTLLTIHPMLDSFSNFGNCISLKLEKVLRGAQLLEETETKLRAIDPNLALWEDELPKLLMYVGKTKYNLVNNKNKTIRPIFGKTVSIPIKGNCILNAGKNSYHFPLEIAGKESPFEASLRSTDFPLTEDEEYNLYLGYTYGEDIPYTLKFIPKNEKRKTITVEWGLYTEREIDLDELPAPEYPYEKPDFYRYPPKKGSGKEPSDLYDWYLRVKKTSPESIHHLNFPSYVLFRDGRTVADLDPSYLDRIRAVQQWIKDCYQDIIQKNPQDKTRLPYVLLLATLHKDAPQVVINELLKDSKMGGIEYKGPLTYVLGDCSQNWQHEIVKNLRFFMKKCDPNRDIVDMFRIMSIFSLALWRQETIVFSIFEDPNILRETLQQIIVILEKSNIIINNEKKQARKREPKLLAPMCEILLALLRLRRSSKRDIQELLSPKATEMAKIIVLCEEKLSKATVGHTFVALHVPDCPSNVPPLLHALHLYLEGADTSGITMKLEEDN